MKTRSYFKVMADPYLPKNDRREAGERNTLSKKRFATKEAANLARQSLPDPYLYITVECWPVNMETL